MTRGATLIQWKIKNPFSIKDNGLIPYWFTSPSEVDSIKSSLQSLTIIFALLKLTYFVLFSSKVYSFLLYPVEN